MKKERKFDGIWDAMTDGMYGDYPDEGYDWEPDYRDAFEDDPEACWGREW